MVVLMVTQNERLIDIYIKHRIDVGNIVATTGKAAQKPMLKKFARTLNKPLKEATEEDITDFLGNYAPSTRNSLIAMFHNLYRWLFDLEPTDRLPDCVRRLKFRNSAAKRREGTEIQKRDRIITPAEYKKILSAARRPQHKAIIETLYLFGVRVSELLSMNAKDVKDTGQLITITVRKSKTKPRDVVINEYPQYLLEWYITYQPFKGQKDKPLWVSDCNRTLDQCLSREGILKIIKRCKERAGIQKNVTNHDFRHTAISRDLENGMPTTLVEAKYGLVHGSKQIQTYDHNTTRELEKYLTEKKQIDRPETYNAMKRKKDTLEKQLRKKISSLEQQLQEMNEEMKNFQRILEDPTFRMQLTNMMAEEWERLQQEKKKD